MIFPFCFFFLLFKIVSGAVCKSGRQDPQQIDGVIQQAGKEAVLPNPFDAANTQNETAHIAATACHLNVCLA